MLIKKIRLNDFVNRNFSHAGGRAGINEQNRKLRKLGDSFNVN